MNVPPATLWSSCSERLRALFGEAVHRKWFLPLHAKGLLEEGDVALLTLEVPHGYYRSYFETYYAPAVRSALSETLGRTVGIKYVETTGDLHDLVRGSGGGASGGASGGPSSGPGGVGSEPFRSVGPTGRVLTSFTFGSFIEGAENALPRRAAYHIAQQPAASFNPFLIYGGVGIGKSHLAQAIVNYALAQHPHLSAAYVTSEQFTSDFVGAVRSNRMASFAVFYRQFDLLVIDDVQFLAGKQKTQDEFHQLFDALLARGAQIIMCSDRPPAMIAGLEERLVSRFQSGLTSVIESPSMGLREKIARSKAAALGLRADDDALAYVAERAGSNVRVLEGALNRLVALQQLGGGGEVTLDGARTALADTVSDASNVVSIDRITDATAATFRLTQSALFGRSRKAHVALARQTAMYLSRRHTALTLRQIGAHYGGRDHSTVSHAVGAVEERLARKPRRSEDAFVDTVSRIEKTLGLIETA